MASASQQPPPQPSHHPAFPSSRGGYLGGGGKVISGKLPDRGSGAPSNMQPPFGSSALAARQQPQPQYRGGQGHAQTQGQAQEMGNVNPLEEIQEDQREEINEAFSLFDFDRDKHLDFHELRTAFRALGFMVDKAEVVQILTQHGVPRSSVSGKGTVGRDQHQQQPHISQLLIPQQAFAQLAAQKIWERDPREEIERAFELFDSNGKGFIDLDDLKRVIRELGEAGLEEEELRAMIEEFDLEGIGGVSKETFIGICLQ